MRSAILAAGLALLLAAPATVLAAGDEGAGPPPVSAASADTTLRAAVDRELAAEAADVATLTARLACASDDRSALALVRAVEQRKRDTARRLLALQLTRARAGGNAAAVAALEAILGGAPPAVPAGAPAARPEPPADGGKGGRP